MKTTTSFLCALGLTIAATGSLQAMSEFMKLDVEPVWPETTTPGNTVIYKVTATRWGQGVLEVPLSAGGLPEGSQVTFSTQTLRFTGRVPETLTATMTVTCDRLTAIDSLSFTVTGDTRRELITVTNQPAVELFSTTPVGALLILDPPAQGQARIRGKGQGGKTYTIQATSNLRDPLSWVSIGSSTADGNGRFTFQTATSQNISARFFRTVTIE